MAAEPVFVLDACGLITILDLVTSDHHELDSIAKAEVACAALPGSTRRSRRREPSSGPGR